MQSKILAFMFGLPLIAVSSVSAQVVSGVMTVTGVEMH